MVSNIYLVWQWTAANRTINQLNAKVAELNIKIIDLNETIETQATMIKQFNDENLQLKSKLEKYRLRCFTSIDEGTDLILEHIKKYNEERRKLLESIRKNLTIKQARQDDEFTERTLIIASDAGNNGVDLRSAFAPLYVSVAVATRARSIVDEPIVKSGKPEIWGDEYKPEERESMLAMKLQFDVTLEAIDKWEPQYVLLDGPILLHWGLMPGIDATEEYWQDFKDTASSAMKLLHECYKRKIPVVGFVKRTRMAALGGKFKDEMPKAKSIRDTALLDLVLRLGQYALLEEIQPKGGIVNQYRLAGEDSGLSNNEIEDLTNFHSAYIRTALTTPFRLELPQYCLKNLDEIACLLYTTSEENGIPFAIHEADRLTKVTTAISNVRSLMLFSKALELVEKGELKPEDLNLLALQYGEPWVLREEQYLRDLEELGGG